MHSILAARTDFSVGESILTIDQLIAEAKRVGAEIVGVTDTMSVTSMIDFSTKAKKADLRPIIGTRLRLTDDATWRPAAGEKKKHMPREYFLTVYARTEAGMRAIFRLLTLASGPTRFYYVPKLGFDDLYKEVTDDLAVVLGDGGSVLEHPQLDDIVRTLGCLTTHLYAPLVPIDTPYWSRCNQIASDLIQGGAAMPLVVRPALYEAGGADSQEIMTCIADNLKASDPWFRSRYNRDMHVMGLQELVGEIKKATTALSKRGGVVAAWSEGLRNTRRFVDDIAYVWDKAPVSLPVMAPVEFDAVVEACKAGWAKRFTGPVFGHLPSAAELAEQYMPRLKFELSILKKLEFSGYFLLVQDIVQFAKGSGILVGPGRGSVGGSLVAYLMGITDVDPIRFGLMFERFINPDRLDLPDADLDFMGERRHEVFEYLIRKYGQARVAGVSNFGTLGAASAIRDVGRVMGMSDRDYAVSKFAPKKHGQPLPLIEARAEVGEIDHFANTYPAQWQLMTRLEGNIRNFATHAAGVVVGGCDLVERAVVETRKDSAVVCWDKTMVENMGLVKVDVLGLKTLDLMKLALDYIHERTGKRIDLNSIPLDQPDVLTRFAKAETTAIFQFESGGMRRLLKELGYDGTITFDDITACTALYRPGPMESGMMDSFYKRKQGHEPIDYDHPLMEPILEPTFGVIVYQEQVMKIAVAIAGYNGADADKLRKIMGKKQPEEMAKERGKFVDGCVATIACDPKWAGMLFDKIEGFAGYGFNKSHSVAYTLVSYQAMWLKVNYGVEFFAAALTIMDEDKLPAIIRDAKTFGITVGMPDINLSTGRFEIVTDKQLVMPFQAIKGISGKTTDAILDARKTGQFTDKTDFLARVVKRNCNIRHQANLDLVGAFARIEPGQLAPNHPDRIKDQIELLPGLISANVPIAREMHRDKTTKEFIAAVIDDYRAAHGPAAATPDGMPVKPHFGRGARFVLICDAPGAEEDGNGIMGMARSQGAVTEAMFEAGLSAADSYWTALIKRPKREKQVSPEEIRTYGPYLDRELDILKPPVIVLMGSITVRTFLPNFKGKASDVAGKVIYDKERDANLVIGFNPGEIYHDPEKQNAMNAVFVSVAELLA